MTSEVPDATDPIVADLERGVRLELLVAPVVVLLPLGTAGLLLWLGWVHDAPRVVALGLVIAAGNLVFDVLMVRAILRFLGNVRGILGGSGGRG